MTTGKENKEELLKKGINSVIFLTIIAWVSGSFIFGMRVGFGLGVAMFGVSVVAISWLLRKRIEKTEEEEKRK